jgi:hypothetical protein
VQVRLSWVPQGLPTERAPKASQANVRPASSLFCICHWHHNVFHSRLHTKSAGFTAKDPTASHVSSVARINSTARTT